MVTLENLSREDLIKLLRVYARNWLAHDEREKDIVRQLLRPSLKGNSVSIRYILFSDLRTHCDAICKFGTDQEVMKKIARTPYVFRPLLRTQNIMGEGVNVRLWPGENGKRGGG